MTLDITEGESEVLRRLARGEKRAEIAEALGVAQVTIHQRIYAARNRTGTRTTYQLLAEYIADAMRREDGTQE